MIPALQRFFKYSAVGLSTFLFDLCLLYLFIEVWSINYVLAAGLAFMIAVSVNFVMSRRYVFVGSLRSVPASYLNFLLIVGIGLLVVMGGMYVLVAVMGQSYALSRVVLAAVTGFWNYLMNLFVNFKVAGKHDHGHPVR